MFGVEPHYGKLRSEVKIVEKEKEKENETRPFPSIEDIALVRSYSERRLKEENNSWAPDSDEYAAGHRSSIEWCDELEAMRSETLTLPKSRKDRTNYISKDEWDSNCWDDWDSLRVRAQDA